MQWLIEHRKARQFMEAALPVMSRTWNPSDQPTGQAGKGKAFNSHQLNDGSHVSPFDTGMVQIGTDGLEVRLLQAIDQIKFQQVLSRATRATTGLPVPTPDGDEEIANDWEEMMRGGLQSALETQIVVFEVWGASRALTHQLVRSRRAGFHQQSQRATWYGFRPEVRMPETVWRASSDVRRAWLLSYEWAWNAYQIACDSGVPYQDARYILPEGTVNYIMCEYTVREFLDVYAYRACSMFLWEMWYCMRKMRTALLQASPWMEPYVKISCEKTGKKCTECGGDGRQYIEWSDAADTEMKQMVLHYPDPPDGTVLIVCQVCLGTGRVGQKCTFQGWENVEEACDFSWAKQENRVFLPQPKYRIGS